jgi:hypothetical protein
LSAVSENLISKAIIIADKYYSKVSIWAVNKQLIINLHQKKYRRNSGFQHPCLVPWRGGGLAGMFISLPVTRTLNAEPTLPKPTDKPHFWLQSLNAA